MEQKAGSYVFILVKETFLLLYKPTSAALFLFLLIFCSSVLTLAKQPLASEH